MDLFERCTKSLGCGNQGEVFEYDDDKVVKIWDQGTNNEKEIEMAIYAGKKGCGPIVYEYGKIRNTDYMIMEKVTPIKKIKKELLIELFDKVIKAGIVNVDGSFGLNTDGDLVIFDYGISYKSTDPIKEYCENDYFWGFKDFYDVDLYGHYCRGYGFGLDRGFYGFDRREGQRRRRRKSRVK